MKQILLFFALFCAFFANDAAAQIKEYPYAVYVPKDHPTRSINGSDVLQGVLVLKNGTKVKWNILYNKKEKKTVFVSFERPETISPEVFQGGIQAMTSGQFFTGVILCYGSDTPVQALNCISNLMVQAGNECAALGGVHCWMRD